MNESDNAEFKVVRFYNRSSNIKKELDLLDEEQRRQAFAIVNKGEYWLFVGGRVYICTSKYKIRGKNSKEFSYQWWILDNCFATCGIFANNRLYIGREDGHIVTLGDEYEDIETVPMYSKDADFVCTQDEYLNIAFNSCFGVRDGDKICLSKHYRYAFEGEYRADSGIIYIPQDKFFHKDGCVALYSNMKIRVCTLQNGVICDGEIKEIYPHMCGIYLDKIGLNSDTPLKIYLETEEKTEYEALQTEEGFMLFYNQMPITLFDVDIERAYLVKRKAVECELVTNLTDLESRELKNLYGISITPTNDTRCHVDIGYDTKNGSEQRSVVVSSTIDFDDLDFGGASFGSSFKQSITVPFFERNFEYIRIKVGSRSGNAFGLENISIIYSAKK